MSLISAETSHGHMRFIINGKGGVNADAFIEFLRRLMVAAKNKIFLIVQAAATPRTTHDTAIAARVAGTPVVSSTAGRISLISAETSRGHMRFTINGKGASDADAFVDFLRRFMVAAKNKIFLIADRRPSHVVNNTNAFVADLGGKPTDDNFTTVIVNGNKFVVPRAIPNTNKLPAGDHSGWNTDSVTPPPITRVPTGVPSTPISAR